MACAILMLALLQLTSMQRKRHWVSRDSQSSDFCATGSLGVDQIENNSQTANNDRNEKRKELEAQTSTLLAPNLLYMSPTLKVPRATSVSEHCRGPCSVAVASSRSVSPHHNSQASTCIHTVTLEKARQILHSLRMVVIVVTLVAITAPTCLELATTSPPPSAMTWVIHCNTATSITAILSTQEVVEESASAMTSAIVKAIPPSFAETLDGWLKSVFSTQRLLLLLLLLLIFCFGWHWVRGTWPTFGVVGLTPIDVAGIADWRAESMWAL